MKKLLAVTIAAGALACASTPAPVPTAAAAAAPVDECQGKPAWVCMGGSGPCTAAGFQGKICSLGIATGLSEGMGQTTAEADARAKMAAFVSAKVGAFVKRAQTARSSGDSAEETQKVQNGLEQLVQQTLSGVDTPKRFYDANTKTTYVMGSMNPEGFAAAVKGITASAKLSEEMRRKIDQDAVELEDSWKAAKDAAK